MQTLTLPKLDPIPSRNIQQFCGLLSIEPDYMKRFITSLQTLDWPKHLQDARLPSANETFGTLDTNESIAVVEMRGVMSKHGSSLNSGGSTIMARRKIRQAMMDDEIGQTLFVIESPGGTAIGTKELGDDVAAHAAVKPITVFFEDVGASAALEVGVRANAVYANAPAIIGSIGTYLVAVDSSKAAENQGYKVHVISTGDFKGALADGAPITEDQLQELQRLVDAQNEFFMQALRDGRGLSDSEVKRLADGRVWLAKDAVSFGLIDGVLSFDDLLDKLGVTTMSTSTSAVDTPVAATLSELKYALPGVSDKQLVQYMGEGVTVTEAQQRFMQTMVAELAGARSELADTVDALQKVTAELEEAKTTIANLENSDDDDDIGTETFSTQPNSLVSAIETEMKAKGLTREQASINIARTKPELFEAMAGN